MTQITFVADEHYHNIRVSMISQLAQPSLDILIGKMLGDVIDEQCAHRTAIIGAGDRAIPLLPGRVPNLSLDRLRVHLDASGGELHPDGGL